MSKHETPMVLEYWQRAGGTLIEEFCLVPAARGQGRRLVDALILPDGELVQTAVGSRRISIAGREVIVVQAKASRLGMYLLGQALFSRELALQCGAAAVRTVALCAADDAVLRPLAEGNGIEVEVMPHHRPVTRARRRARGLAR
jgi:hypothetical protein